MWQEKKGLTIDKRSHSEVPVHTFVYSQKQVAVNSTPPDLDFMLEEILKPVTVIQL